VPSVVRIDRVPVVIPQKLFLEITTAHPPRGRMIGPCEEPLVRRAEGGPTHTLYVLVQVRIAPME